MNLNAPKPFIFDEDKKGLDWIVWKKNFLMYLRLLEINRKLEKEEKAYLLLNLMGEEVQKTSEIMTFGHQEDKEDVNVLIRKFDEMFIPTLNEIEERYKFFSRKKQNNESIHSYVMDLREKAASCNFQGNGEKFIRDMVILNMEEYLREKALQQELSLREVILLYKQNCTASERTTKLLKDSNLSVNAEPGCSRVANDINNKKVKVPSTKSVCWRCSTSHPPRACPAWGKLCEDCNELHHLTENCNKEKQYSKSYFCKKCGTSHPYKQCPAYGVTCTNCLKKNHFNSQCSNKKATDHLDNCDWCESKHLPGECPHDEVCPKCDKYPHNICFQCKENPHIPSCIFKELIHLPMLK